MELLQDFKKLQKTTLKSLYQSAEILTKEPAAPKKIVVVCRSVCYLVISRRNMMLFMCSFLSKCVSFSELMAVVF